MSIVYVLSLVGGSIKKSIMEKLESISSLYVELVQVFCLSSFFISFYLHI